MATGLTAGEAEGATSRLVEFRGATHTPLCVSAPVLVLV